MHIDSHLLLALYLLVFAMTIVLYVAWYFNPEIKGLREWFSAYLAALINVTFFITHAVSSEVVFMLISQATLMATGYFALKGCCRHMAIKCRVELIAIPIILVVLGVCIYYTVIENKQPVRFFLSSLVSGLFFMAGAFYLLRDDFKAFPSRHLLGITLFAHGLFNALRPVLFTGEIAAMLQKFTVAPTDLIIYEQLIMTSLLPLGVVMLANEVISLQLRKHAEHDSLTGLYNRRMFLELLHKNKSLAVRMKRPLSLLVLDIDKFKLINDTYGHLAGDEVLIDFAANMQKNLRQEDVIGRMGGEEFAIFLPDIPVEAAVIFAERLRAIIEGNPAITGKGVIDYTISIGVANLEGDISIASALEAADAAMYAAKRSGRNKVVYQHADAHEAK